LKEENKMIVKVIDGNGIGITVPRVGNMVVGELSFYIDRKDNKFLRVEMKDGEIILTLSETCKSGSYNCELQEKGQWLLPLE